MFVVVDDLTQVAREDDRTELGDAIHRVFDRNEDTGHGPTSLRALAKEIVNVQGGDADVKRVEEWRRRLRRYMSGERQPTVGTLALIATALGAEDGDLPAPVPRTSLRRQVEALQREVRELRSRLDHPQENV